MNALDLAVIHDAKNSLSGVVFRLEEHGHFEKEIALLLRTSSRLTSLLLWHKQQDGEMQVNIDTAFPIDLVKDIVSEYSHTFPHVKIDIAIESAPAFWFYDDNYVRLALSNAVHNACSFAKDSVHISALVVDNMLMFKVKDNGKGYSERLLAHFADQAEIETTHRGTGLGLQLAKVIARLHQSKGREGDVVLKNEKGAVFEMSLP